MIKVLIADDHALFRDGLKRIFSEIEDIDVVAEAVDGKDILKKVRECDWDIALLDINLPDINGLDILKRILSVNSASRILVLRSGTRVADIDWVRRHVPRNFASKRSKWGISMPRSRPISRMLAPIAKCWA